MVLVHDSGIPTAASLRQRLKTETAAVHRAVERLYEQLDVSEEEGLRVFLIAHAAALAAIEPRLQHPDAASAAQLLDCIRRDLAALGAGPPQPAALDAARADPVGLTYVMAGSRLGVSVLARRVMGSACDRVRAATSYLGSPFQDPLWPRVRQRLDLMESVGARADQAVAGAMEGFACFERGFWMSQEHALDGGRRHF